MAPVAEILPQGFLKATTCLNRISQAILAEMCQDVVLFLLYKKPTIGHEHFVQKLLQSGIEVSEEEVHSAVNGLIFIFSSLTTLNPSPENTGKELRQTFACSDSVSSVIKHIWNEQKQLLIGFEAANKKLQVGQVVDLAWSLGIATSSDSCRSLNAPYVALKLRVAEASGQVITRHLEMSIPEFQNFSKQIKNIGNILDTI